MRRAGVALGIAAAAVLFRWSSPAFPDPDMLYYGLFARPVPIKEAMIEACREQGGEAEEIGSQVICGDAGGLWWAVEVE